MFTECVHDTPNNFVVYVLTFYRHIGGIMVSVLASSVVDHRVNSRTGQAKTIKVVCAASPFSIQH